MIAAAAMSRSSARVRWMLRKQLHLLFCQGDRMESDSQIVASNSVATGIRTAAPLFSQWLPAYQPANGLIAAAAMAVA